MVNILETLQKWSIPSAEIKKTSPAATAQATANTAETIRISIPKNQPLAGIDLRVYKDTDATLTDTVTEIRLLLDGVHTVKKMTGSMLKAIAALNGNPLSTGFYSIPILDPVIQADPIPCHKFNTIELEVDVAAGGASVKNVVAPSFFRLTKSGYPRLADWANAKILVETYNTMKQFGTVTGEQEVEHDRVWKAYGYMAEMGDNGSLSNTIFNTYSLVLIDLNGEKLVYEKANIAQERENNKQTAFGNAMPTGIVYLPFVDGIDVKQYSVVKSLLNIPSAGTNAQVKVLERRLMS